MERKILGRERRRNGDCRPSPPATHSRRLRDEYGTTPRLWLSGQIRRSPTRPFARSPNGVRTRVSTLRGVFPASHDERTHPGLCCPACWVGELGPECVLFGSRLTARCVAKLFPGSGQRTAVAWRRLTPARTVRRRRWVVVAEGQPRRGAPRARDTRACRPRRYRASCQGRRSRRGGGWGRTIRLTMLPTIAPSAAPPMTSSGRCAPT